MDKYFYSVEESYGDKLVHFNGNIYFNDGSTGEKDYRIAEWVWMYIKMDTLVELRSSEDKLWELLDENVRYLGDLSKEEADEICREYFDGTPGQELDIDEVNSDTAYGNYWFDR